MSNDENPPFDAFTPSSWSSTIGVADAIASYRRSQFIITGQTVSSSPQGQEGFESFDSVDEERQVEELLEDDDATPMPRDDDILASLQWEDDLDARETPSRGLQSTPQRTRISFSRPAVRRRSDAQGPSSLTSPFTSPIRQSDESSPLLHKSVNRSRSSFTLQQPLIRTGRRNLEDAPGLDANVSLVVEDRMPSGGPSSGRGGQLGRKLSSASIGSEKQIVGGRSTFGQTLFNSIAILLGFGMLSEPLAFAYAGWIGGTILILCYGWITCYTAKILAHIMIEDPSIRTYADIGNKAFGQRSRFLTSALFCLELFSVSVVLVTLYGDSLHEILPSYSSNTYKIIGLSFLIPSVLLPLSFLSYASILGIISTLLIIGVLFIDGLSKVDSPGSLWRPSETSYTIAGLGELGVAFGLFMAGFSGHAVLPSLARDMVDPRQFDQMINCAFLAATVIYLLIGGAGYLMFGESVSDEVSRDLLATPGYNAFLNHMMMWSLVVMPLTKFALTTRPVNISLEIILGLEHNSSDESGERPSSSEGISESRKRHRVRALKDILTAVERSTFACLSVAASILIPNFSSMMAFLGSFSAFMLCVIGPISAKIALAGKCTSSDIALLVVGTMMAVWGTVSAFAA